MKTKRIYEPIFQTNLFLVFDCDFKEAEKCLKKNKINTNLNGCAGQMGVYDYNYEDGRIQRRYYIFVRKEKKANIEVLTLIHELSHLVFRSLEDCGIRINVENDEVFTYYLEYFLSKIITNERPKKKHKKPKK